MSGSSNNEDLGGYSSSGLSRAFASLDNSEVSPEEIEETEETSRKQQLVGFSLNAASHLGAARRGLLRKSSKKHLRSSSFTNQTSQSSGHSERPGLFSTHSYDSPIKTLRGHENSGAHQSKQGKPSRLSQSPRLFPQSNYIPEVSSDTNIGSSPIRPSSAARSHSSASTYTPRNISNRDKSKSQLNLVTMSPPSSFGSTHSPASKRRETISHSPKNTPSGSTSGHTANNPKALPRSSANNSSTSIGSQSGSGYRYYSQEKAYLKKIQNDTRGDHYSRTLGSAIAHSDVDSDSDDDSDLLPREAMGLGGVGTSFDDEYTDNVTSYPFLEASYNHEEMENDESLPERLEWQAMLASVLTGEVVQSEKRRLKTTTDVAMKEDDLWLEIRARMCARPFEAQKRSIEDSRANVEASLLEIMQFRVSDPSNLDQTLKEVNTTLLKLEHCEQLWQCIKKIKSASPLYRDPSFQRHIHALTTWSTITEWIIREIKLLQLWTGNEAADPTLPPDIGMRNTMTEGTSSLVERVLKQEDLMKVLDEKIKSNIGPVIERARESHLNFQEEGKLIGLPVYVEGLEKLMKFPIKLIQEIVSLRLVYAKRMTNPTTMLVDQIIEDLSLYMNTALLVKERNLEYTRPVSDIDWITYTPDSLFDKTVLDCVVFFFELSSSKFTDNSFAQAHRGFNEIDNFLDQYRFLEQVGRFVKGGETVVAIQSWYVCIFIMTETFPLTY